MPLLTLPVCVITSSMIYPSAKTPKPIPIAKKAIVSLNSVGLPVFLNPIYEIIPIIIPTEKPIRFRIISNKNSNVANLLAVLNKV